MRFKTTMDLIKGLIFPQVLKYYAEQQVISKQVPDETADLSEEDEGSEKGDEEDNFESELDSSLINKKSCDDSEDHCTSEDIKFDG